MGDKYSELKGYVSHETERIEIALGYISKYSVMVRFINDNLFTDGTHFNLLSIHFDDTALELGPCLLKTEANVDGYAGRLVFTGDIFNMDSMFQSQTLERLQAEMQNLPLVLSHKDKIHQAFKDHCSNLAYDLRVYQTFFNRLDKEYEGEPDHIKNEIQLSILQSEGKKLLDYLDTQVDQLDSVVKTYSKKDHQRHGFYFRKLVWDFIVCSPFLSRCNIKPRGYSGDSKMMSMIYTNDYEGDSTFAKLLHKHEVEHPAAQAVRNRRELIIKMLKTISDGQTTPGKERLNILSVACGPAFEIQDILRSKADFNTYDFTLLDQDKDALLEASELIDEQERKFAAKANVTYLNDSVRTMIALPRMKKNWGGKQFRFIYSLGLYDYLTPPVARAVLGNLYQMLEPGGELVIGNFHVSNPSKNYMEYWADWVLYHRTENDFLDMLQNMPSAEAKVLFEDTKSQMFLHVKKPG